MTATAGTMFCYQCEQTAQGKGCTAFGVCGKDPKTAALQDLLVHATEGVAQYAHRAAALGARDREVDVFVVEALFTTVTNVNFDPERVAQWVRRAAKVRDKAKALYEAAARKAGKTPETLAGPATLQPAADLDGLVRQAEGVSIRKRTEALGADLPNRRVAELAARRGVPVIDTTAALRRAAASGERLYLPNDTHRNVRGNAVAGAELALALARLALVPTGGTLPTIRDSRSSRSTTCVRPSPSLRACASASKVPRCLAHEAGPRRPT